jgi:hypothetical protein
MKFSIHIDRIYETPNFMVQIDDHEVSKTYILDDAFNSVIEALFGAICFLKIYNT